MAEATLHISDNAAQRIQQLATQKGGDGWFLRIGVDGGGCAGFQYDIHMDNTPQPDDVIFTHLGASLRIDPVSLPFLVDSTVDYVEKLGSASFEIKNPQSTSSCGCGSSFAMG